MGRTYQYNLDWTSFRLRVSAEKRLNNTNQELQDPASALENRYLFLFINQYYSNMERPVSHIEVCVATDVNKDLYYYL